MLAAIWSIGICSAWTNDTALRKFKPCSVASFSVHKVLVRVQWIRLRNRIVFALIVWFSETCSLGGASAFMPDYTKAKIAFANICELFDRKPSINNMVAESRTEISDKDFNGNISFNSINFNYPTRPDAQVLQNFSLNISKSQRIALVGSSGCGT
jgi:ABC-type multidrug transport system fused ATPase/permease subunit